MTTESACSYAYSIELNMLISPEVYWPEPVRDLAQRMSTAMGEPCDYTTLLCALIDHTLNGRQGITITGLGVGCTGIYPPQQGDNQP